ncbi:ankyrin repeat domain protein [Fusarium tjaetaba]|uniref:Ankyrin repeat domain protein n=1 Tax=Fusarium tjaetaba TaxID=1567544 RepID=A0A8H5RL06_9HYPO|nr:ankyrin repeat domain protein [Fusarium tjaetaba]KAF5634988.1 ankyrin repeat domain protein [Fusarium tjaetaba]
MPVSTLSCPPCRKAKKKARKRKIAATDIDDDKPSESLLLEVFWLERLTQYSKSALAIHQETCDRLDLPYDDYYGGDDVYEVLEQIEENRALVRSKIEACESNSSLAALHYFLSKSSSTYYSWEGGSASGFAVWFAGETETTSSKPPPDQQASLALYALKLQECRLLENWRLLWQEAELSSYAQKYSEVMQHLRTIENCTVLPLPWTHNLLSLIEGREERERLISSLQATEEKDMFGRSLLHLALDLGVGDDAVHLLSSVANEPDIWGRLPIHIASFTGCIDLATRLIYGQAEIQMKGGMCLQPLHYASAAGHLDIVNLLIGKVKIDPKDQYGKTPLIFAAKNGHVATATMLLENGANIEMHNTLGWTPLLHAIARGRVGIVDLLLRKGARVKPMMETKYFMSHLLTERHLGVVKLLLEHGAVEEFHRFSNESLLRWAAKMQDHHLARQLVLHEVIRTPIATNGIAALSYAAEAGNHEIVVELLENGMNPNERCSGRELPLSYAVVGGHVSVTKELLKHNANPNARSGIDMEGQMVIVKAYELRNPDIIDHLVAWGADISAIDSRGSMPTSPAFLDGYLGAAEIP